MARPRRAEVTTSAARQVVPDTTRRRLLPMPDDLSASGAGEVLTSAGARTHGGQRVAPNGCAGDSAAVGAPVVSARIVSVLAKHPVSPAASSRPATVRAHHGTEPPYPGDVRRGAEPRARTRGARVAARRRLRGGPCGARRSSRTVRASSENRSCSTIGGMGLITVAVSTTTCLVRARGLPVAPESSSRWSIQVRSAGLVVNHPPPRALRTRHARDVAECAVRA